MEKNISPIKGDLSQLRTTAIMGKSDIEGDLSQLRTTAIMMKSNFVASESFYRLTESGDRRITEDGLSLRLLEDAP